MRTANVLQKLFNYIGLDPQRQKYAYGRDDRFGFMAREKIPEKWTKSTCGYCSVGCGMLLGVKEGKIISVKGDPDHPVNIGRLCPKGLAEHYSVHNSARALYPMQRRKPSRNFYRLSWDEALNVMVRNFRDIQERHGPDSVAVISTGQLLTEEFYALGKLVQLGFGSRNYDGNTTLCMATAVAGYKRSFGSDGPPGAYEDLELADCVFLIGANIADNHPILISRLNAGARKGRTVIVVDPRISKTAMMADMYLPLKPRSDLALLNGIMYILVRDKLYDQKYIDQHTDGFSELAESLKGFTPERVAELTGLSPELIIKTAHAYGRAKAGFIAWTMGVNHSSQGTDTVAAINNLAMLTGKLGRPGSSPFSITGQCNAMGSRETSFTSSLPGYRSFESAKDRSELAALWGVDESRLPQARGHAYPDIIEAVVQGKIKGLWIIATNPIVSYPHRAFLEDALDRLDYLVVQDGFHPIPSSRYANLVLPAAIWGEKEGTYTNSERRVSKANAVVAPPGEARSDFDIFMAIAEKLGLREELFPNWKTPSDAFIEWQKVSQGRLCDYSGMDYKLIEEVGGIQWPFPKSNLNGAERVARARDVRRLYADGEFRTSNGRARFSFADPEELPESPSAKFPLLLNTGRTVEHWHTRTKTGNVPILERMSPEAWLEMNPADAQDLNLRQGEKVRAVSKRGRIEEVSLRITEIVAPGQVFMPFHWHEANANNLTLNVFDPVSREPNYKQCAIRVEKLSTIGPA